MSAADGIRSIRSSCYTSLDFAKIVQLVIQREVSEEEKLWSDYRGRRASNVDDDGVHERDSSWREWPADDDLEGAEDECNLFESVPEEERVVLCLLALRRQARAFAIPWGGARGTRQGQAAAGWGGLASVLRLPAGAEFEGEEGSLFADAACLPELLVILPLAAQRCPSLVTPEHLVRGLLLTPRGSTLLLATLAAHPPYLDPAVADLAGIAGEASSAARREEPLDVVPTEGMGLRGLPAVHAHRPAVAAGGGAHLQVEQVHAGSVHGQGPIRPPLGTGSGGHAIQAGNAHVAVATGGQQGGPLAHPPGGSGGLMSSLTQVNHVNHGAAPAVARSNPGAQTLPAGIGTVLQLIEGLLVSLCQAAPHRAARLRTLLVTRGALPELVLHITAELAHDELEFLSHVIFESPAEVRAWLFAHVESTKLSAPEPLPSLLPHPQPELGRLRAGAGSGAGARLEQRQPNGEGAPPESAQRIEKTEKIEKAEPRTAQQTAQEADAWTAPEVPMFLMRAGARAAPAGIPLRAKRADSAGKVPPPGRGAGGAFERVWIALQADARRAVELPRGSAAVRLQGHLRLVCAMVRLVPLQLTQPEVEFWLAVLAGGRAGAESALTPPAPSAGGGANLTGLPNLSDATKPPASEAAPPQAPPPPPAAAAAAAAAGAAGAISVSVTPPSTGGVGKRFFELAFAFLCLVPGLGGPPTRALYHAAIRRLFASLHFPQEDAASAATEAQGGPRPGGGNGSNRSGRRRPLPPGSATPASETSTEPGGGGGTWHAATPATSLPASGAEPAVFADEREAAAWAAMQLLLKRFAEVAEMVRAALGVHLTVHNASLRELAEASAAPGGPLHDPALLVTAVAAERPRRPLCGHLTPGQGVGAGSTPERAVECLQALLLQGTLLARSAVDISPAVTHCIARATLPIHPALPGLIQSYAEAASSAVRVVAPAAQGPAHLASASPSPQREHGSYADQRDLRHAVAPHGVPLSSQQQQLQLKASGAKQVATPGGPGAGLQALGKGALLAFLEPACRQLAKGVSVGPHQLAQAGLASYYLLCRAMALQEKNGGGGGGVDSTWERPGEDWERELLEDIPWRHLGEALEAKWLAVEPLLPQWYGLMGVFATNHDISAALQAGSLDTLWLPPGAAPGSEAGISLLPSPAGTLAEPHMATGRAIAHVMSGALQQPGPALAMLATWQQSGCLIDARQVAASSPATDEDARGAATQTAALDSGIPPGGGALSEADSAWTGRGRGGAGGEAKRKAPAEIGEEVAKVPPATAAAAAGGGGELAGQKRRRLDAPSSGAALSTPAPAPASASASAAAPAPAPAPASAAGAGAAAAAEPPADGRLQDVSGGSQVGEPGVGTTGGGTAPGHLGTVPNGHPATGGWGGRSKLVPVQEEREAEEEEEKALAEGEWAREALVVRALAPLLLEPECGRLLQQAFFDWWEHLSPAAARALTPVIHDELQPPAVVSAAAATGRHPPGPPSLAVATGGSSLQKKLSAAFGKDNYEGCGRGPFYSGADREASGSGGIGSFSVWGGVPVRQQLLMEPSRVLACNARIFRAGPVLSLVLKLLERQLASNRRACLTAVQVLEGGAKEPPVERDELASALLLQDSAVCQLLLEACVPDVGLGDLEFPGQLAESRALLLAAVGRMVQDSPLLLKLLLFQGFELSLVKQLVGHLAHMQDAFGFVPELLAQPHQHRQLMGLELSAELALHYPSHPNALPLAQQAIAHVARVKAHVAGCGDFLRVAVGQVARCVGPFPQLLEQAFLVLQSCMQAAAPLIRGGRPRDKALLAASKQALAESELHLLFKS